VVIQNLGAGGVMSTGKFGKKRKENNDRDLRDILRKEDK
jgi:hypothetical protein